MAFMSLALLFVPNWLVCATRVLDRWGSLSHYQVVYIVYILHLEVVKSYDHPMLISGVQSIDEQVLLHDTMIEMKQMQCSAMPMPSIKENPPR
jgi:hypothetical protein